MSLELDEVIKYLGEHLEIKINTQTCREIFQGPKYLEVKLMLGKTEISSDKICVGNIV